MSLTGWTIEPSLAYVGLAGLLYWLGGQRRGPAGARHDPHAQLRALAFCAGLVTLVLALDSPLDHYADELFWAHMLQHVLLLTVAPPLILLGRPWPRMWRALPLSVRSRVGRAIAASPAAAPLRRLARPVPAWLLFNATVLLWHLPAAYDATLRSGAVHLIEHAMFFFTGLLFWARVIDPGPLKPRLVWPARIAYVAGAMVVGWMLAIALVLAPTPIYAHYAALLHRPGGISAITDQQLAGGVMWVPGSIAYTVAFLLGFYRWLDADSHSAQRQPALTT